MRHDLELIIRDVLVARVVKIQPAPQPPRSASPNPLPTKKLSFGMKFLGIFSSPVRRIFATPSHPPATAIGAQQIVRANLVVSPVEDFGSFTLTLNENMADMLRAARTYNKKELIQNTGEHIEEIHSCTLNPNMHLIRCSKTFNSMALYIEEGIFLSRQIVDAADELARIIRGLVTDVFQIPLQSAHLFRDKKPRIIFNLEQNREFGLFNHVSRTEPQSACGTR